MDHRALPPSAGRHDVHLVRVVRVKIGHNIAGVHSVDIEIVVIVVVIVYVIIDLQSFIIFVSEILYLNTRLH